MLSFLLIASGAQANDPNGGAKYQPETKSADAGGAQPGEPGTAPAPGYPTPVVEGTRARLLPDGTAAAPAAAPPQVQQAIWASNANLLDKPYRYGGGHASFQDTGYDCSGTISFALNAAGVLKAPLDSSGFMAWGKRGKGRWVTVYANPGHAYTVIAGLRLDTSRAFVRAQAAARTSGKALEKGPRWRPSRRPSRGFTARHPLGF